jgi:hypothetical protein
LRNRLLPFGKCHIAAPGSEGIEYDLQGTGILRRTEFTQKKEGLELKPECSGFERQLKPKVNGKGGADGLVPSATETS